MSIVAQDNRQGEALPTMPRTVRECLDRAAFWLYEAERVTYPQLASWDEAIKPVRDNARFRARAAFHEGDSQIRRVRIQRIAQALATANGFIWPRCDNKINRSLGLPAEHIAATVAEIRQNFLWQARLVDVAQRQYMEVLATDETPEVRASVLSAAHQQEIDDAKSIETWRRIREGRQ